MRFLLLGDVHGNLPALELVLEKERDNYDKIICHGDVVNYGPWSNECVQLFDQISNVILLKGNHEEYFLLGNYPGQNKIARAFFDHCYPSFMEFTKIAKYQLSIRCGKFIVQHSINNTYIFNDTEDIVIYDNYVIGHSHQQFRRQLGDFELVNTGSIGQNRTWINDIEYVIYDAASNKVELNHQVYNHHLLINEMRVKKYPQLCIEYYLNKNYK